MVEVAEQMELVISIDDDQLPSPEATRSHGRSLRSEPELQDTDQLCVYPVGRYPNIIISFEEYKTLEHDIWARAERFVSRYIAKAIYCIVWKHQKISRYVLISRYFFMHGIG